MMRFAKPRFLHAVIWPGALLLLVLAWGVYRPLTTRVDALDGRIAALQAELTRASAGAAPETLEAATKALGAETAELRALAGRARTLAATPRVKEAATRPFQLIEFEQARAAVEHELRAAAGLGGVKLAEGGLGVESDAAATRERPDWRWAQLELARLAATRAISARVTTFEVTGFPAPRAIRLGAGEPVLGEEVLIAIKVTGPSNRLQAYVELLALGDDTAGPLFIDRAVLRKEGTQLSDLGSATLVVSGLLPPPPQPRL